MCGYFCAKFTHDNSFYLAQSYVSTYGLLCAHRNEPEVFLPVAFIPILHRPAKMAEKTWQELNGTYRQAVFEKLYEELLTKADVGVRAAGFTFDYDISGDGISKQTFTGFPMQQVARHVTHFAGIGVRIRATNRITIDVGIRARLRSRLRSRFRIKIS